MYNLISDESTFPCQVRLITLFLKNSNYHITVLSLLDFKIRYEMPKIRGITFSKKYFFSRLKALRAKIVKTTFGRTDKKDFFFFRVAEGATPGRQTSISQRWVGRFFFVIIDRIENAKRDAGGEQHLSRGKRLSNRFPPSKHKIRAEQCFFVILSTVFIHNGIILTR